MTRTEPSGPRILVTGAARGIGAALAHGLAARGARLGLVGLEDERLEHVAYGLAPPGPHCWRGCDVTDHRALAAAVAHVAAELGGLDVVVANAGIASRGTVAAADPEALVRVLDVNLAGVVRTVAATLPYVAERRGYYLLMSSAAAFTALPGMSTYAASKAGVEQFAHVLRLEVAHLGVDVGVAFPSWVDTDLVRDVRDDSPAFESALRRLPGPFGRVTSLEECSRILAEGVLRRERQIFVPRSLALISPFRRLLSSSIAERLLTRYSAGAVRQSERETRTLGRSFGKSSTGMGEGERGEGRTPAGGPTKTDRLA